MKDFEMSRQERFLKAKAVLDKCVRRVSDLAGEAYDESIACCGTLDLDTRDDLSEVAALLRQAEGFLIAARAKAGRIDSGGITRGGGT